MLAQRASSLSENLTKVGQGCITGEVIGDSKPRVPDILRKALCRLIRAAVGLPGNHKTSEVFGFSVNCFIATADNIITKLLICFSDLN